MPYFIEKDNAACTGWAVTGPTGTVHGCHTTKASAIKQAVAISLSTDEPFAGERAAVGELSIGDYVTWDEENPMALGEVELVVNTLAAIRIYEQDNGVFSPTEDLVITNIMKLKRVARPDMVAEKISDEVAEPQEPADMSDELMMDNRAEPDALLVGDFVSWNSSGGRARGRIVRIVRDGEINVPNSSFTITGTEDDPAALIALYRESEDGYQATATRVGHKFSTLTKIDSLNRQVPLSKEGPRMTDVMDEARSKWVKAAWAIKARLENLPEEARSLGGREIRTTHTDFEIREDGDGLVVRGYAALFNSPSHPLPFVETIERGAFKKSLQSRNRILLLWNHNAGEPLASNRNGSLKLFEDEKGLAYEARMANTSRARDVSELLRSKVIDSMSFGFSVKRDAWSQDGANRTLQEVSLHEISIVSYPAYEGTAGTLSIRESREIDAEVLAESLSKLEVGSDLTAEEAGVLTEIVASLTNKETDSKDEQVDATIEEIEANLLELKRKQLELIKKKVL
jgi:HK97 family phage prohead protease